MLSNAYNFVQARLWQEKRKRIRAAAGVQKLRLLQSFGEEIHEVSQPTTYNPSEEEIEESIDLEAPFARVSMLTVLIGAVAAGGGFGF